MKQQTRPTQFPHSNCVMVVGSGLCATHTLYHAALGLWCICKGVLAPANKAQ